MQNEIKNMRLVQIITKKYCEFIENVPSEELDISKQIYISDEDRLAIGVTKCFDVVNNCVVDYDDTKDKRIQLIEEAIRERKIMLDDSDYKLFKYIEGEMTASEFEPIKSNRALWRKEINQLEEELQRYGEK